MTAPLSEEEFQRMQMQLLELRTKNYTLGEKNVKIQTELLQNNALLDDLRKELAKSQKIISRSKNAKEVEQLIQENETLQSKLQIQEDEFRLQNETLMHEISSLVSANDEFKKELELVKSQQLSVETQGNNIRLEAENAALKKLLASYETETRNPQADSESKLDLNLETLIEEKKILQENLRKLENEYREQLLKAQNDFEKLSEKLKKKQESFLQFQEEKERLFSENKKSFEELESSKNAEIQKLRNQICDMQIELRNALEFNDQFDIENVSKEKVATIDISGDKATFDCSVNETKLSLISIQEKMQQLNKQLLESENQKKMLESKVEDLHGTVQNLERQKSEIEEALSEKTQLAEKRKKLMDEMNNHLLDTTNKHSKEIENLTRQLSEEQEALQKLFDKEKETKLKLIDARNEVQSLKEEVERLRSSRCSADDKFRELEEKLQSTIMEHENRLAEKDKVHSETVEMLKEEMESNMKDLNIQLEVVKAEKIEFEEKVKLLQQEAKDSVDERKIQEKKGLTMVKDLKRQLLVERNRAEKLQERLQEVLNEQNRSVDDILQSSGPFDKPKGDASSISSWSYVSGGTAEREAKDGTVQSDTSSGGHESPNRVSPTMLETETSSLLAKVTQLQQKNWTLEEKVNHLEMSNEALVDDVLKKTALIQFYCMEGRSDHHSSTVQDKLTIKRIVDFIKDRGDENLKEMNRRMQRMLEETLTKNMHLQKDIETLSNEVSRLSKLIDSPVENGIQSAVFVEGL
ncbi:GRIP1-associated protein 1-like [Uloborus diversus]|uniref:GRIP1-associated protein 1-like n=1 Tax=Uloborus diversus TaxID=327109 RepID=UPI002409B8EB|nr:GRIP1-associated protein 1-like [Uloborus diversus]